MLLHGLAAASALLTLFPTSSSATPLGRSSSRWSNSLQARQATLNSTNTAAGNGTTTNTAAWDWTGDRKLNGVALGNWLLLERWMDEQWFTEASGNTTANDEWTFSLALGDRAQSVLEEHWNTWITDDDVRIISESGFNHIRIPIGYWAFMNEPAGTPYVSMGGQLEQMTRVIESAANYGLYVIIDLHGLPGSQNGEQASGHVGYNNFYQAQNQNYSDTLIDLAIDYIQNSTHRNIITALATCNEPVFYSQDQFDTLVSYYERAYDKLSTVSPPIPMMFHPGHPEKSPMGLFQSFINGKDPQLLIYEDHPYPGRLQPQTSLSTLTSQICAKATSYESYGIPVAVTEWSISTATWNDTAFDSAFWSTQLRAWSQSAGAVFWSYKVNAYTEQFNQTENFTLYSFYHLRQGGNIPLPSAGQDSQAYLFSLDNACDFGTPTEVSGTVVPSVMPTVTGAFTKRAALPAVTAL